MANTVAELVFVPAPGVGHMMSTIEIAKLLVSQDQQLSITVLVIKQTFRPISGSAITTYIKSLTKKPMDRISFIAVPQDENILMITVNEFINSRRKYVRNIVANMIRQPGFGRIAGFVVDMFCTSMIDVANEFNVPTYVFGTSNAAFLGFKLYIQTLCDDHSQDIVELSNSDAVIPIPSFVKPVPTKVFPAVFQFKEGLDLIPGPSQKLRKAKAIMVNTFSELETQAIKSSSDSRISCVCPVGPIINLQGGAGFPFHNDVISWLDSQPPSSVVFLCFGSLGCFEFDEVQVKEIAHALERCGHCFVWSLGQPPPPEQISKHPRDYEDPGVVLPEGFLERTAGIGKVIGWAPQVALLLTVQWGGLCPTAGGTHCWRVCGLVYHRLHGQSMLRSN